MDAGWVRLRAGVRDLAARRPGAPLDPETAQELSRRSFASGSSSS